VISLLGRGFVVGVVAWLIIEVAEVFLATFMGTIATYLGKLLAVMVVASLFLGVMAGKAARMKKQGRINV
jgi:hypothetical protein